MQVKKTPKKFEDWLYAPQAEELVCYNPFRQAVLDVFEDKERTTINPSPETLFLNVAKLIRAELVMTEGDVVYVRDGRTLYPLGEAVDLLAYYMHTDSREARKAIDVLETNFQGYFPIDDGKVWRNGIALDYGDRVVYVDLSTLSVSPVPHRYPEFGVSKVDEKVFAPLVEFFSFMNDAVGDPWFFEKTIMYPFNQRIREKSHVLVGGGGNGKSLFMSMIQRLYGSRALTDAPQPNFSGHSAGVISYNFIGKRLVTFNDVEKPSAQFLEWMKRMITGNLEVKTPSGAWLTVPCQANFLMETNHRPEILDIPAHKRRFVVRHFHPDFMLRDVMTDDSLDLIGDRGEVTAGDLVNYLMFVAPSVPNWTDFSLPEEREYDDEVAQ